MLIGCFRELEAMHDVLLWILRLGFHPMPNMSTTFRASLTFVSVMFAFLLLTAAQAQAVGGEGESWPSFNESDGCGSPWSLGPNVESKGWLPGSTVLRGPQASYFGRTVNQVFSSLVWWDVPGSNDESLRLHVRALPALSQVETGLGYEASQGRTYSIVDTMTFGYTARTVGGRYRVSQHAFGNAVDINSTLNPYSEGELITNMPPWFVNVWSDAGFCWGGNWISVKDAMHFNWRGPAFTDGFTTLPAAYSPLTSAQGFTRTMYTTIVPGSFSDTRFRVLMDGDGDSAIDVVNIGDLGAGSAIDVIRARTGYRGCAVRRYVTDERVVGTAVIAGDWDRNGSQDLWVINDSDGLSVSAYLRFGDFTDTETVQIATSPGDAYVSADHNVDGWGDLYILRRDGATWTVEVRDGSDRFSSVLASASFPAGSDTKFTAIDRDLDQVPDLVGVSGSGSFVLDGASGFSETTALPAVTTPIVDVAGTDFDGDGRHDIVTLSGTTLRVLAGNSPLAGLDVTSWFESPDFECDDPGAVYPYEGSFRDDDQSIHAAAIEAIAQAGITKGCNPPVNDKFCPENSVTRGQMAAFLVRGLGLTESLVNPFTDDDGSIFEEDIERLAAAGITKGCNPPANTRFCPAAPVTRGQMAAFLVRAIGYTDNGGGDLFTDDDNSPFEGDIDRLGAAGVTKGCNPPANTRFCPNSHLTRAQMATFLVRALSIATP